MQTYAHIWMQVRVFPQVVPAAKPLPGAKDIWEDTGQILARRSSDEYSSGSSVNIRIPRPDDL